MMDRIFSEARLKKLALGQERLANTLARLVHTIQGSNGGSTSSKEAINALSSKGSNISTWYEGYRALPEKICDALSFPEFVKLEMERVGIGTGSKPQATRGQPYLGTPHSSVDAVHKEGLEGKGLSNPRDEILSFKSHPHAREKSDLNFKRDGAMKDEDLVLTPIIVPESQHDEVITNHCLANTDNMSTCVESRIEREDDEQIGAVKGEVKGM
ncbi:hypothetical protein KI387_036257, partial [Taxus chinensis]